MSRAQTVLSWLEDKSDLLSPIVVKEVRQIVRGREFNYAFGASLVVGLAVAFFGAADALTGSGTSGRWTFTLLMVGLAVLGLGVVPLGAFSALRNERMERTLDLITLTALSPRRVILGKLLAQSVKLLTLFAAIAPFIAMSFLLGGIDFITILVSLLTMFMWSVWVSALCLFLSTLFKSRALSGIVFGGFGLALLLLFSIARSLARFGGPPGISFYGGPDSWWVLAIVTSFCLVSLVNLVLLGENRLTLPTENRVTSLRLGLLVQFLLIVGWTLSYINDTPSVKSNAVEGLVIFGGLHLAAVAIFTVSEDLVVPRRVVQQLDRLKGWRSLGVVFMPGGGRGAAYILAQMAVLIVTAWALDANGSQLRWIAALCGYICFFTGTSALAWRSVSPEQPAALRVRVSVLVLVLASTVLPDLIHYVVLQPEALNLSYNARHVVNPFRTMANWGMVETYSWVVIPSAMGIVGVLAYLSLLHMGMRATEQPVPVGPVGAAPAAEETGSANVVN